MKRSRLLIGRLSALTDVNDCQSSAGTKNESYRPIAQLKGADAWRKRRRALPGRYSVYCVVGLAHASSYLDGVFQLPTFYFGA